MTCANICVICTDRVLSFLHQGFRAAQISKIICAASVPSVPKRLFICVICTGLYRHLYRLRLFDFNRSSLLVQMVQMERQVVGFFEFRQIAILFSWFRNVPLR